MKDKGFDKYKMHIGSDYTEVSEQNNLDAFLNYEFVGEAHHRHLNTTFVGRVDFYKQIKIIIFCGQK